jgi:hypothetical protein
MKAPEEMDPTEIAIARTVASRSGKSDEAVAAAERFLKQDRFRFTIDTLVAAFEESLEVSNERSSPHFLAVLWFLSFLVGRELMLRHASLSAAGRETRC